MLSYLFSEDWASVIAWVVAAVVVLLLVRWQQKKPPTIQNKTIQDKASTLTTSAGQFDATQYFEHSYMGPLNQEVEDNVRKAAHLNRPDDPESFYTKLIGIGLLVYIYDIIWAYIFRSQILLLMELNRRIMPLSEVKAYYDKAAEEFPLAYNGYSFNQYKDFMKFHLLLIEHPSGMFEITRRGKDFLTYLVHWGRYPDDRRL